MGTAKQQQQQQQQQSVLRTVFSITQQQQAIYGSTQTLIPAACGLFAASVNRYGAMEVDRVLPKRQFRFSSFPRSKRTTTAIDSVLCFVWNETSGQVPARPTRRGFIDAKAL